MSESVAVETLKYFGEVALFMAPQDRTPIDVAPHDICCDIGQLQSTDFCTGRKKRNINHMSHVSERVAIFAEILKQFLDGRFRVCISIEH